MSNSDELISAAYIAAVRHSLNHSLSKIKHCLDQLDDSHMGWRPFEEQNSLTNLILHLCGNMRQWIISAAGDAPDTRNRPAEFAERQTLPKAELSSRLSAVIGEADRLLAGLSPEKLLERRRIQAIDTHVLAAIFDSVSHLVGHTHQIVYITRLILREKYIFQWAPKTPEQGAAVK
jgi:uncharacterized protein DUF1572